MKQAAYRPASYQDILELPDNLVGEIVAGELHTHPRPAPRHAGAYSVLGYRLDGPFDGGIEFPLDSLWA